MTITVGKKFITALSLGMVSLTGIAATPALARHDGYRPGDYYRGYDYSRGGYDDRYYRRGNYSDNYRRDRGYYDRDWRYRCRDEGKGGAVIGAIAGGLLGSAVTERGSKTTGTVVGAAVGAVTGHLIDKGDGRRC